MQRLFTFVVIASMTAIGHAEPSSAEQVCEAAARSDHFPSPVTQQSGTISKHGLQLLHGRKEVSNYFCFGGRPPQSLTIGDFTLPTGELNRNLAGVKSFSDFAKCRGRPLAERRYCVDMPILNKNEDAPHPVQPAWCLLNVSSPTADLVFALDQSL